MPSITYKKKLIQIIILINPFQLQDKITYTCILISGARKHTQTTRKLMRKIYKQTSRQADKEVSNYIQT